MPVTGQGWPRLLALALRIARCELRGGIAAMGIFLVCLTLGVAAMAAVGALSAAIERGLAEQGRPLLGGDIELSLVHRQIGDEEREFLSGTGALSEVASLRAMARSDSGQTLVEVKAVDGAYPLYGQAVIEGAPSLAAALAPGPDGVWGAAAEPGLLARLGLAPGDRFKLGNLDLELRGVIAREPDRVTDGFILSPRLMIALPALGSTGLVRPGSLVRWHYRVKLDGQGDERTLRAVQREARDRFPDAGWRIRNRTNAAPSIDRFVERVGFFLSLVALTALVVGGVGIANAVKSYLDRKRVNIAILKCLGASRRLVFASSLIQVLMIAALGITLGLTAGAAVPLAASLLPSDLLPVPVSASVPWAPLAMAGLFGFLTTLAFALWPLAQARETPASMLFRGYLPAVRRFQYRAAAAIAVCVVVLAGMAFVNFSNRTIVGWYTGGLIASFIVLALLARLVMRVARDHARPASALVRFAVANLHRPGAATPAVMISVGIALSLFVTLGLVDGNIRRELTSSVPAHAPSFFFIDVDRTILEDFTAHIAGQPGVGAVDSAPMLRGRIVGLNGRPVEAVRPGAEAAWAVRGDRGLTYAAHLPEGSRLVEGEWWPADHPGPPLVSMVDEIAHGLGLEIGDTVKVNVLGRDIEARIANLRSVDWRSLQINFVLVFSPDALAGAPHGNIVTVAMDEGGEEALMREVAARYPAVTAIRVKEALDAVNDLMGKLLAGLRAANGLTLAIGIAVLTGAVITSLSARMRDVVILKTYGATRRQLLAALAIEFALLGLVTALFAILAGTAGAWVIVAFVLEMPWRFDVATALLTVALALAVTLAAGLASTWSVLGVRPAPMLRMA